MKPCFARMKNFLTSFSQHVGSGGGGCVLASRSSRPWPGNFSLLSGISHKKKDGKGFSTFCCIGNDTTRSQPQGGRRRDSGRQERQGRRWREGRACCIRSFDQPYIKKGRPPYDGRPDVQQRKGPTGPDPPARGSLPDLPDPRSPQTNPSMPRLQKSEAPFRPQSIPCCPNASKSPQSRRLPTE